MGQRGRKKGSNGEKSRAVLLDIATKEFAQQGYFETKVSTIVKKANVTQPTFYLYFESKEAIFQELVDLFRLKLTELTQQSRLGTGIDLATVPDKITQGLAAIFRFFYENQDLTRIGLFVSHEAEKIKQDLAKQMESNLIVEQKNGYFDQGIDMGIAAETLVGVIERLTLTKLFKGIRDPDELAKDIVHIFFYGLRLHK
ncbi:TetR/AcrR family transcriptional regulator [Radiobacillus kanasensis]|uniref:TetR/AcrR family transcriptional regulator n=1 Tax=Radiobacillus kanasensis TaxID=2844358 RepID=UPI001E573F63|nr:TetR/AcrR family transcriptional regulator [Radiobacillus kanasensis]UFT99887.1 TetR/AcrR family transcriptional regulator [Radiobacillus kanasensis]